MMTRWLKTFSTLAAIALLSACTHTAPTTYERIGGQKTIDEIVDNFITEIEYDKDIFPYFAESNIDRFREKLAEQLCVETDGPCEYSGDSMAQVHTKMNVTEAHFNLTVDLLINAMNKADVPHPLQNKILQRLAPMRDDIIYR